MSGSRSQDILAILRGLRVVNEAFIKENEKHLKHIWINSSIKELLEGNVKQTQECITNFSQNPTKEIKNLLNIAKETYERSYVVAAGLQELAKIPSSMKIEQVSNDVN